MTLTESAIYTVSSLTQQIKGSLEKAFPSLYLRGEVSNFRRQSSGHLYFSLKDSQAQISAVMFRGSTTQLNRLPKEGDQVLVQGELNVYPPRGQYQIIVRSLQFTGAGELLLRLEELKQTLAARGWFAPERKRPLPLFPRRIGLVTSPTGAAVQDMLNVLTRRHQGVSILLNGVRVQGEEAAREIAQAIEQFNHHHLVDVIIVGRGGGSIEDLWPFNEEIVAHAIVNSSIPIVSAVGHETDHTIADFAADLRAPTPSAAAELVVQEQAKQRTYLLERKQQCSQMLSHHLARAQERLKRIQTHPLMETPYTLLGPKFQRCDDVKGALDRFITHHLQQSHLHLQGLQRHLLALNPLHQCHQNRQRLQTLSQALALPLQQHFKKKEERLQKLVEHLSSIDPRNLLKKGYSILLSDQGAITSIRSLHPRDHIQAQLADGMAKLTVDEVTP